MHNIKTSTLIGIAIMLAFAAAILYSLTTAAGERRMLAISSFQECALAGYPIMETYPERCATPDGRTFVNIEQANSSTADGNGEQLVSNGCAVAGCSSQLCVSAEEAAEIVTTCEYRAEYACYKEASCEPQADGKCGWTQTGELTQCLNNPPTLETEEPQAL